MAEAFVLDFDEATKRTSWRLPRTRSAPRSNSSTPIRRALPPSPTSARATATCGRCVIPELCPGDLWEEVFDYRYTHEVTDEAAFDAVFAARRFSLQPGAPPLEVNSALGGLGIYKMRYFCAGTHPYLGSKVKLMPWEPKLRFARWQCCEHAHFHQGIGHAGGRLFVMPDHINGPRAGTPPPNPSFFRSAVF
jgi:hypothetical protein